MSRVLFVVPPLVGHVNPTVSVGAELTSRGHQVAWAGLPDVVDSLLPNEAKFLPVIGDWDRTTYEQIQERSRGLRGVAALKFLWQDFLVPLARTTASDVDRAIDSFDPALLPDSFQTRLLALFPLLFGLCDKFVAPPLKDKSTVQGRDAERDDGHYQHQHLLNFKYLPGQ